MAARRTRPSPIDVTFARVRMHRRENEAGLRSARQLEVTAQRLARALLAIAHRGYCRHRPAQEGMQDHSVDICACRQLARM